MTVDIMILFCFARSPTDVMWVTIKAMGNCTWPGTVWPWSTVSMIMFGKGDNPTVRSYCLIASDIRQHAADDYGAVRRKASIKYDWRSYDVGS